MIEKSAAASSFIFLEELLRGCITASRCCATAVLVICLTLILGAPRVLIGAQQSSGSPVITANPERVTISDATGSSEIAWETGNGSEGFVYVTGNDRKPVLFATGSKGTRTAPWIRAGAYVFELYGDAQRQTLLAKVTVSGITEKNAGSLRAAFWQRTARWVVVIILVAILYIAIYLSSTGTLRTTFSTEPTTSPRPLHVARNFLLGLAAFICVDGMIFHTNVYVSILAPDSYAGRLAVITRAENQRPRSNHKEVLVLGDSRMAEGFSTAVADKVSAAAGLKFVTLAEPASSVNTWYYMLRDVDPGARRYWAVVIPYGVGYEPSTADPLRISMAAPLLRYGDCFNFASAFQRWSGRFKAFTACILRGSAYQSDVVDLLEHPLLRVRSVHEESKRLRARSLYRGRDYDLKGTSYDPKTGQVTFAPKLTESQRQAIRKSLVQPSQSETDDYLKLQRDWIQRIIARYSNSSTAIVLTPVPRGPFVEVPGFSMAYHAAVPSVTAKRTALSLPQQTFDFLEQPEYYFDAYHLNAKGRERFTETLVTELVGHLGSAGSSSKLKPAPRVAVARPPAIDELTNSEPEPRDVIQ